jgi:hypothetical protein
MANLSFNRKNVTASIIVLLTITDAVTKLLLPILLLKAL